MVLESLLIPSLVASSGRLSVDLALFSLPSLAFIDEAEEGGGEGGGVTGGGEGGGGEVGARVLVAAAKDALVAALLSAEPAWTFPPRLLFVDLSVSIVCYLLFSY